MAHLTEARPTGTRPTEADVGLEASRRIEALGYARWAAREKLTGIAIPTPVKIKHMQIQFVASALCRLKRIPMDYRLDAYWPG